MTSQGNEMPRKKKGTSTSKKSREKIAECLPNAIDCAIRSYRQFYEAENIETAKEFSAHHTACKTAIAHIELLLKLAEWANIAADTQDQNLAILMADAQAELENYQNHNDPA